MYKYSIKYNICYLLIAAIFMFALFIAWTPHASADIVVEGDIEFRDDVNECINTYGNTPGMVGDVIEELEKSDNEHKIVEGPDWANTVNDNEDAFDGTGTGTTSEVSKEELERIKERIDELDNKDFCTALLHELWHAVDADRGEWSNDKLNDVLRDEIEATIFQNFIHALRGVDPRTSYGNDISEYVLIGEAEDVEEAIESEEGSGEPEDDTETEAEEQPEPPSETEDENDETNTTSINVVMDYEHVAPGEYSEIYVTVTAVPGAPVSIVLTGPGVDSAPEQSGTADGEGVAQFTWRIVSFGTYSVSGTADGEAFSSEINVQ